MLILYLPIIFVFHYSNMLLPFQVDKNFYLGLKLHTKIYSNKELCLFFYPDFIKKEKKYEIILLLSIYFIY